MKKIIALIAVLAIMISILNISVYADTSTGGSENGGGGTGGNREAMTADELRVSTLQVYQDWIDGKITWDECYQQADSIAEQYAEDNNTDIGAVYQSVGSELSAISQSINYAVQKYGDNARDYVSSWWNDILNKNNVPTETTQTSTTDFCGYGAIYEEVELNSSFNQRTRFYYDYIIIYPNQNKLYLATIDGRRVDVNRIHDSSHGFYSVGTDKSNYNKGVMFYGNGIFTSSSCTTQIKLYGDIRYADGSQAPTDDDFDYSTIKKFDEMDDNEIVDLLKDISEKLEQEYPDLTSLEGLLKAIYARMGKLDSDNDNELLAAINSSILSLVKSDGENKTNNEELINTLLEIREALKNGTLGTSHGHEISGTVYNVIPLDKNFINKLFTDKTNLKVQYEGKVYYLEDCGCLKIGDKYYTPNMNYDSYAFADYDFGNDNINIDTDKYVNFDFTNYNNVSVKLTSSQRKKIDNIVDLIYKMVSQAVPYAAITSAFAPFEVIIFNTAAPEDIVLNFNGNDVVGDFSATILSVSFFQSQYVSSAMDIIKPFLTVVIGYSWLKVMRRKAVSMLG